jgi:hypothetical protein
VHGRHSRLVTCLICTQYAILNRQHLFEAVAVHVAA